MSLSDETGVSSDRGCAAHGSAPGMDISDCEGAHGRCTACGRTTRRGEAPPPATLAHDHDQRRRGQHGEPGAATGRCGPHHRRPSGRKRQASRRTGPADTGAADRRLGESAAPRADSGRSAADAARPGRCCPAVGRRRRTDLRPSLVLARVCAAYAVVPRSAGVRPRCQIMGDFGLSAAAAPPALLPPLRPWAPGPVPAGLAAVRPLLGDGVPGQPGLGWYEVVLRQPVPSPSYADLFLLCFAPPAIVGLLVLAKRPVTKAPAGSAWA